MASCPIVRQRILDALSNKRHVRGSTIEEVKQSLGLADVSTTQVIKALGSLCYKHRKISWHRLPSEDTRGLDDYSPKDHVVTTR